MFTDFDVKNNINMEVQLKMKKIYLHFYLNNL